MTSEFLRLLTAAQGFCEMGMWQDAWDELEKLGPEERAALEVLRLRLGILVGLKRWESAALLATRMIEQGCQDAVPYQLGALAVRRYRSLEEVRTFLLRSEAVLSGKATWHYTLACFECQLGDLAGAKVHLARAFEINPELRAVALYETDLAPLW